MGRVDVVALRVKVAVTWVRVVVGRIDVVVIRLVSEVHVHAAVTFITDQTNIKKQTSKQKEKKTKNKIQQQSMKQTIKPLQYGV